MSDPYEVICTSCRAAMVSKSNSHAIFDCKASRFRYTNMSVRIDMDDQEPMQVHE